MDMTGRSPRTILGSLVADLIQLVPGIREGDADSIHDARIATRRLREVLPLLATVDPEYIDAAQQLFRDAGRRLGVVRELDAMREHLALIEKRFPEATVAAAVARRTVAEQQQRARRRLIKQLERLNLAERAPASFPQPSRLLMLRERLRTDPGWAVPLRERIRSHAHAVTEAVDHASGVYFPKRAHTTRIAVKKLRYSIELAEQTGLWRPPRLLRDLRRLQGTLGSLHDAQVLLDALPDLIPGGGDKQARIALEGALRAEIDQQHREYISRRDRLKMIAAAACRFADNGHGAAAPGWRSRRAPLVTASALAVPTGLLLLAAGRRS
jgi:CHAD domain-containing protein